MHEEWCVLSQAVPQSYCGDIVIIHGYINAQLGYRHLTIRCGAIALHVINAVIGLVLSSCRTAQGRWRLLWSSPQSDFSRTQRRFGPIPTRSIQLIGEAGGLEATRAANLVQIAGGAAPLMCPLLLQG